jgi:hypothetical protein
MFSLLLLKSGFIPIYWIMQVFRSRFLGVFCYYGYNPPGMQDLCRSILSLTVATYTGLEPVSCFSYPAEYALHS